MDSLPKLFSSIFELVVDSGHGPTLEITSDGSSILRLVVIFRVILTKLGLLRVSDLDRIRKWLLNNTDTSTSRILL